MLRHSAALVPHTLRTLLAVDLGVHAGLALYADDGRLRWYRSQNFGTATRLRRAVPTLLAGVRGLAWLVVEGGGELADVWERESARRRIGVRRIGPEAWRRLLIHPREPSTALDAKRTADFLARRVIDWSVAPRPASLRHDAAEAILAGLWGVVDVGWLEVVPPAVRL